MKIINGVMYMDANKNPLVSVIVPVYNVEKYLDRCVGSIVKQTYHNLEIILVDDGSPDDCPAKCDEWAVRDGRIKVVHKKNGGLGYARNSGLEIATGDYVAFVDSDDYIESDMYATLIDAARRYDADMVSCGFRKELADGTFQTYIEFDSEQVVEGEDLLSLAKRYMLSYWHKSINAGVWHGIYRRSLVPDFISERVYTPEDLIFNVTIGLRLKKYVYVNRCFYNYMYNAAGLCRSYKPDDFEKMVAGANYLKKMLLDYDIYGEAERYIFTRSIFFHRYFIMSDKNMSLKDKYKEIKRLISLPDYNAMLNPEFFRGWHGKKMKYVRIAYNLQRKLMGKAYFMYLLFDKTFVARK